ncbi:MAG: TIGR04283 family arsenosugar biosynthesis glycosyltransferase [Rhodobacteraceae bacterium]|nr:TIGR04283 family arsenosugar biosynthesis glycosyltransferase [Paracoccaceae bacterium]
MRAPLSIVIPTLNAGAELPDTLASLMEGVEAGLVRELVISDGGSEDDTLAIADAAGAVLATGTAGRGSQLARGAEAAAGPWLLFLHADTHLAPGWTDAVQAHIAEHTGAAGYFRLAFRARGLRPRIVAGWANLRSRAFGLPYGDQGVLIPRALYDHVGGYPEIPLMEDVAIARALRGRLLPLDGEARTSAVRYQQQGWLWRGARNLLTLTRYLMGADPERLARAYKR